MWLFNNSCNPPAILFPVCTLLQTKGWVGGDWHTWHTIEGLKEHVELQTGTLAVTGPAKGGWEDRASMGIPGTLEGSKECVGLEAGTFSITDPAYGSRSVERGRLVAGSRCREVVVVIGIRVSVGTRELVVSTAVGGRQ